jgi:hypothetical protein
MSKICRSRMRLAAMPDITGANSASAGEHGCATLPGGRADCWGFNRSGELGDGTLHSRSVPAPVLDP